MLLGKWDNRGLPHLKQQKLNKKPSPVVCIRRDLWKNACALEDGNKGSSVPAPRPAHGKERMRRQLDLTRGDYEPKETAETSEDLQMVPRVSKEMGLPHMKKLQEAREEPWEGMRESTTRHSHRPQRLPPSEARLESSGFTEHQVEA